MHANILFRSSTLTGMCPLVSYSALFMQLDTFLGLVRTLMKHSSYLVRLDTMILLAIG